MSIYLSSQKIISNWIDYNNHMNVSYYLLIFDKYGADILRIWVANSNFTEDVRISFENLDRHSESYRKIRNSLRFLLGNLNGWDVKHSIEFKSLPQLEKYILHRLFKVSAPYLSNIKR